MEIVHKLGLLAIASRLDRLSAILKKDAASIYKEFHGNIKYKWYPIIFVIYNQPLVSVGQLATELSYAHPSIIEIIEELEKEKLIKSAPDKKDSRKRLLSLTPPGKKLAEKILPYSKAFEKALLELTNTENNLMKSLGEVESLLTKENFFKRVKRQIEKQNLTIKTHVL